MESGVQAIVWHPTETVPWEDGERLHEGVLYKLVGPPIWVPTKLNPTYNLLLILAVSGEPPVDRSHPRKGHTFSKVCQLDGDPSTSSSAPTQGGRGCQHDVLLGLQQQSHRVRHLQPQHDVGDHLGLHMSLRDIV